MSEITKIARHGESQGATAPAAFPSTGIRRTAHVPVGTGSSAIVVLLLVLAVFGGAIYQGYRSLQGAYRAQMIDHDGEVLYAVAQKLLATNTVEGLHQQAQQMNLLLVLSQLEDGCLGVRLYDGLGQKILPMPLYLTQPPLDAGTLAALDGARQISRFKPAVAMSELSLIGATNEIIPVLEVNIPVRAPGDSQLLACYQFLLNGTDIEKNFTELDRGLRWQAWALFIGGGIFLTCALGWGYWRLQKANRMLAERTARLLRANHELTLAAKTTALGAVTAHLIHGLSNPLANLHELAAAHKDDEQGEWQEAIAATQRMQQLVREVVRVLSESKDSEYYDVTLEELTRLLACKVQPLAEGAGVQLKIEARARGQLASHHANLILLVLENLVHNAVQVTPRGKVVSLSLDRVEEDVVCEVRDQGSGIPDAVRQHLFTPCRSTKGGSGLGLAISQQLAHHIGGRIDLKESGPGGCAFALTLPQSVWSGKPETKIETAFWRLLRSQAK